jgi:2-dehydropantoate 2-reductase
MEFEEETGGITMNIVVLGAGATGGYFGGRLTQASVPVTFLVRERRYHQLKETGLHVQSSHGDFTVSVQLALTAKEIDSPDVVVVALKNYHLEAALPELRTLVQKGAKILPLLNGVKHMDELLVEFGPEHVLGGTCYIEATLDAEGRVLHTSPMHDVVFGSLTSSIPASWLSELEDAFKKSGVNVRVSSSIMTDMWQKFIFLTSFSGITAATRKSIGEVMADSVTTRFLRETIQEILSVAFLKQENLPTDLLEQMMSRLHSMPLNMTSSLHRDLEKGLPLEIDSLQGAILKMAAENGLSTPSVSAIYAILHPAKEGK